MQFSVRNLYGSLSTSLSRFCWCLVGRMEGLGRLWQFMWGQVKLLPFIRACRREHRPAPRAPQPPAQSPGRHLSGHWTEQRCMVLPGEHPASVSLPDLATTAEVNGSQKPLWFAPHESSLLHGTARPTDPAVLFPLSCWNKALATSNHRQPIGVGTVGTRQMPMEWTAFPWP